MSKENLLPCTPELIPTKKKTSLVLYDGYNLAYSTKEPFGIKEGVNQFLYFTSRRDIQECEYGIDRRDGSVFKTTVGWRNHMSQFYSKIEATTDRKLIADGVPAIPVSWLPEYYKLYTDSKNVGAEKLADEYLERLRISSASLDQRRDRERRAGFIQGFDQAVKINSDKRFTLNDIDTAIADAIFLYQKDEEMKLSVIIKTVMESLIKGQEQKTKLFLEMEKKCVKINSENEVIIHLK